MCAETYKTPQPDEYLFQLKQAVEIMQLGLTISDLDGRIVYANFADAAMHGYQQDELIGKNVGIYAPPELRKPPTLDQLKQWKGLIRESVNLRKDGTVFPVWLMSEIVKNSDGEPCAIVTSCEDITERKQSAETLRRQAKLLRGAAEAMNCLLANMDFQTAISEALGKLGLAADMDRVYLFENHVETDSGRILMSQRYEWVSAAVSPQIENLDLQNVPYESACPRWYALLSQNLPVRGVVRDFPAKERETLEAQGIRSLLVVPIMIRDEFWGFIGFDSCQSEREWRDEEEAILLAVAGSIGDALARKQAEEELRIQREAKILAEAASESKSEFLRNMSHELRTPLNGILGYTQILKADATLSDQQRNAIEIIHRSGEHLLLMINEILDLSKIESREMSLEPCDFKLPDMLAMLVDMMRIRAEQKGLEFVAQIDHTLPAIVYGDEKRLRQILLNLLGNAVKFTDHGKVAFHVNRTAQGQYPICKVQFSIEDTGIGIAPEHLEHIFSAFYQVHDARRSNEGTGLGLAISQRLAGMMGTELHAESLVGKGSRFWFEIDLPASQLLLLQTENRLEDQRIIGFNAPTSFTILIADDNQTNRSLLRDVLSPLGFKIVEAENGAETISKMRAHAPDLLLLDLVMPVFDGLEATRQIRQMPEFQQTPIIAISASVSTQRQQECFEVGCWAFLPKPFSIQTLLELLRTYLPLEWRYASEEECDQQEPLDRLPAREELHALYQLALGGQLTRLRKRLQEIQTSDSRITPFAQKICQYLQEFQVKKIQACIREYMEDSHE
ncbi:PAS fold family [Candidatus Vecturithrix granuli]|uniref:histidine kinase n=1 Tax=Vecturithrix granuli TaxID=1499967 RepID=A0A081BW52_VECG1|nr:PAS fold family [Candidatus Vecturithrix granuli]